MLLFLEQHTFIKLSTLLNVFNVFCRSSQCGGSPTVCGYLDTTWTNISELVSWRLEFITFSHHSHSAGNLILTSWNGLICGHTVLTVCAWKVLSLQMDYQNIKIFPLGLKSNKNIQRNMDVLAVVNLSGVYREMSAQFTNWSINFLSNSGWSFMKFVTDIHEPQRLNLEFVDSLIFALPPPWAL